MMTVTTDLDMVSVILSFCGNAYLFVATVNKTWRRAYGTLGSSGSNKTSVCRAVGHESMVGSVLPALRSNESLNSAAFYHASKAGNVSVLDRLLANRRPLALFVCASGAVAGGSTRALSWAVSNGFPLDRFVCHSASRKGGLEMLVWAVSNGCAWDPEQCMDVSRRNGHRDVEDWIRSLETPI